MICYLLLVFNQKWITLKYPSYSSVSSFFLVLLPEQSLGGAERGGKRVFMHNWQLCDFESQLQEFWLACGILVLTEHLQKTNLWVYWFFIPLKIFKIVEHYIPLQGDDRQARVSAVCVLSNILYLTYLVYQVFLPLHFYFSYGANFISVLTFRCLSLHWSVGSLAGKTFVVCTRVL